MKLWELVSILREEKPLLVQSLSSLKSEWTFLGEWITHFDDLIKARDREKLDYELPTLFVRSILTKYKLTYYLSQDGCLRSFKSSKSEHVLSALETFDRYGGNIMEEVLEKGSAKVL